MATRTLHRSSRNRRLRLELLESRIPPAVLSFQIGDGYFGLTDTSISAVAPEKPQGSSPSIRVEQSKAGVETQSLIKFDNLFGSGTGQIPGGSTIVSASLSFWVGQSGANSSGIQLNRMAIPWDATTATWNSFCGNRTPGVQLDGFEAAVAPDGVLSNTTAGGYVIVGGLAAAVQSWVNRNNFGWVITSSGPTTGWSIDSSESTAVERRPVLTVQYTPPTTLSAPTYQALVGAPPSAMQSAWFAWQTSLENQRLARVPSERAVTYYFAQNGDDVTGTGAIDQPWKSLTKAQTVINAATGDIRLRFRRGDTWLESSVLRIDKPSITIDSYGATASPAPLFSRFTTTYVNGWSLDILRQTWFRSEPTPVGWLRLSSDPNGTVLHRASSLNEVRDRVGAWFYDTATARLYYHAQINPNAAAGRVEAIPNDGQAWSVQADNVRMQDLQIQGSGLSSSGSGVGLRVSPGAGGEFVGMNVAVTWAGGQGISIVGTSAIATLIGCSSGLFVNRGGTGQVNSGDVTPFDIDGGSGLNEIMLRDCIVVGGALPSSDWDARPGMRQGRFGINEHTNGPAFPPALSVALRTKYPDAGWQVAGGTNVFGPSVANDADVRAYIIGEAPADGIDSVPGTGSGDRIYVNNVYTHLAAGRPVGSQVAAYSRGVYGSWVVNTTVRFDLSNLTIPPTFGRQIWSWYRSNQPNNVRIENSRFEVTGSPDVLFEFLPTFASTGSLFHVRNSIVAAAGFRSLSLGAAAGAGRLQQNAYALTPLPTGTLDLDPAGVPLASDPGATHVPAAGTDPLYGGGIPTSLEFDQNGAVRVADRNDIGPMAGANVDPSIRNRRYWELPGVGQPPSPDDSAWFTWEERLQSARLAAVPLSRQTTYYFSQSGNDLTGDGSAQNPFQSMEWANSLLSKSSAANVQGAAVLRAPDVPELESIGRDFTIAYWGNITNTFFSLIAQRPHAWNLGYPDNSHFGMWTGIAGQTLVAQILWPTQISQGWHYYAASYSSEMQELRISIDGSPWLSTHSPEPGNGISPFQLLSNTNWPNGPFSDVGYWSSAPGAGGALSNADLATMYRSGLGRRYEEVPPSLRQNLASWWALDDSSSTNVYADKTGNAPLAKVTGFLPRIDGRPDGEIRLRFRGGDTWRDVVGLTVTRPNVTVDSYGNGMPYFSRFVDSYTTGWQQVAGADGNLWKRNAINPVGWLRPAADPLAKIYKLNDTSEHVGRDEFSFYYDADGSDPNSGGQPTLYINAGSGIDPNLVPGGFETAPFGGDWMVTSDNVRMENLRVHGAGISPVGNVSGYGLLVFHSLQGFAEFVGVNLEFYFTGYHAFGHISDRTSMVLIGCRAGLGTNRDGTGETGSGDTIPYVSFAGTGGQEFVLVDNEVSYGTLPSWDWNASPGMRHGWAGIYTHTNPGYYFASLAIALRTRYPDNPWQVNGGTNIGGPIVNSLKDVRGYIVGEAPADGIDSQPGLGYSDRVYLNNVYTHLERLPAEIGAGLYYGPALASWVINTTVRMDGSGWTPSENGHAFYFAFIGSINIRLINCFFEVINNDGDSVSLIQPYLGNVGSNFLMQNTILSIRGSKPGAIGPIGFGRLDHNAYYFEVPNPNGTNTNLDPAPTFLTSPPRHASPSFSSPLFRAGAKTALGYDRYGRPRSAGNADIGPYVAMPIRAPLSVSFMNSSTGQEFGMNSILTAAGPIDRIMVRFNADVDVVRTTLQIVTADGGIIEGLSVIYDPVQFTATWVLPAPLTNGSYRVLLDTSYNASVLLTIQ